MTLKATTKGKECAIEHEKRQKLGKRSKTKGANYERDVAKKFKKAYDADVFFIIGADSLYTLDKWKAYKDLIKECAFIVADRNCEEGSNLTKEICEHEKKGGKIELIKMPKIDITSTLIRDKLSKGEDIKGYVPEAVRNYIKENGLYKSNPEE